MFGKKCQCCGYKIRKATHEFRINTAEGLVIWQICDLCAGLFDQLADELRTKDDTNKSI